MSEIRCYIGVALDWLAQYPPTTRADYAHTLTDFRARIGIDAQEATQDHMSAYQQSLNGQATGTVYKKLAALSSFFTYLNKRGMRTDDPLIAIKRPKVDNLKSVRYLTSEQVADLMDSFDDTDKGIRDRALVRVFLHGLRLAEAVGLNVEDYREGSLRVTGKGNKQRIVPLLPVACEELDTYIGRRKTGPLFVSVYRKGDRIERRAVQNIVYAATERIGARLNVHALRHTCGTMMMRATGNLAVVQETLGHADPATTRIYAHLDVADKRRAMEQSAHLLGAGKRELRVLEAVG